MKDMHMKRTNIILLSLSLSITALGLNGCGGGNGSSSNTPSATLPPGADGSQAYQTVVVQNSPPAATFDTTLGTVYVASPDEVLSTKIANLDYQNFTLYTFENDAATPFGEALRQSNCNLAANAPPCADVWPPLFAPSDTDNNLADDFTIVVRQDGAYQWAYKGMPLYLFAGRTGITEDSAAGDINGENVDAIWFVSRPDPWKFAEDTDTATDTNGDLGNILVAQGLTLDLDEQAIDISGQNESALSLTQIGNRYNRADFTLYTFDADTDTNGFGNGTQSACFGQCEINWPALYADRAARPSNDGQFTLITREDGIKQWAYRGYPLHYYAGIQNNPTAFPAADSLPGDDNGHKVNGWFAVRPDPFTIAANATLGTDTFVGKGERLLLSDGGETLTNDFSVPTTIDDSVREDKTGFVLYTFDLDVPFDNDSTCFNGNFGGKNCANVWPPLYADIGTRALRDKPFSIVDRRDGSRQWAHNGRPLYFFAPDTQAGVATGDAADTSGDGEEDWDIAKPAFFEPTLSAIQTAIFTPLCTSCHGNNSPAAGLSLTDGNAHTQLVSVATSSLNTGNTRVIVNDAVNSFLIRKLDNDSANHTNSRMPLGGLPVPVDARFGTELDGSTPYLEEQTVDVIRQWIRQGAEDN